MQEREHEFFRDVDLVDLAHEVGKLAGHLPASVDSVKLRMRRPGRSSVTVSVEKYGQDWVVRVPCRNSISEPEG